MRVRLVLTMHLPYLYSLLHDTHIVSDTFPIRPTIIGCPRRPASRVVPHPHKTDRVGRWSPHFVSIVPLSYLSYPTIRYTTKTVPRHTSSLLQLRYRHMSCHLASCHSLTCDSFVYHEISRNMHFTRANCFLFLHIGVYTWNHDLVEVRYTHVRDIISHCKHIMRVYKMANNNFLVYLWQGVAVVVDVECPTLVKCIVVQYSINR